MQIIFCILHDIWKIIVESFNTQNARNFDDRYFSEDSDRRQ